MHASVKFLLIGLSTATLLGACASKSYVVLLDSPDGSTGKVVVHGNKGEQVIERAGYGATLDGAAPAREIAGEQIRQDFGPAMAARPMIPERYQLYFDSGGTRLTAASQALLPKVVEAAARRPAVDVSIIGHTDTVGRPDENEALALKRAQAVAELMRSKGLQFHALSVESHGERNLLIKTADEVAEPKNRRVEISLR